MTRQGAGAISGALATVPMTLLMEATHKLLPAEERYPLPPREITMRAAGAIGAAEQAGAPGHRTPSTLTAHFGMGAATGIAYAPFAGRTRLAPAVEGMLFGAVVWGASYLGVMPGLGLSRSAQQEPAPRNALMIGAHLVYGAALGSIFSALTHRS